jgi:hypothetical protein
MALGDTEGWSSPAKPQPIFEDEAAHQAHGRSAAVRKVESVYSPQLAGDPVVFADYVHVATNR